MYVMVVLRSELQRDLTLKQVGSEATGVLPIYVPVCMYQLLFA